MKKRIRFTLKIKDCAKEFKKGLGKGVFALKELEYDAHPDEYNSATFAMEIIERQQAFLDEHIEVIFEEVTDADE